MVEDPIGCSAGPNCVRVDGPVDAQMVADSQITPKLLNVDFVEKLDNWR